MLYFLLDELTKHIKIGFTDRTVAERIRELQTGSAGQLFELFSMAGTKADEDSWHERFAACHERGEHFRPEPDLLLAILELVKAENAELRAALDEERIQHDRCSFALKQHHDWLADADKALEETERELAKYVPPPPGARGVFGKRLRPRRTRQTDLGSETDEPQ
jgi:hypothetical protein